MTTTDDFTARESATIDLLLAAVSDLRQAVAALNVQVIESNRQAARTARELRRTPPAPVAPVQPPSMNPIFLIVIGVSLFTSAVATLHALGVL